MTRAALDLLQRPNPHAVAALAAASASTSIVATQDICDERGVKLWARDQPVSAALRQQLLERKLREPIESCLRAENGVTVQTLHADAEAFLDGGHPLAAIGRDVRGEVLAEVGKLPLHPVAQLLLTTLQAVRPQAHEHAVRAMVLTGCVQHRLDPDDRYGLRLALLAGALHDLGDLYLPPAGAAGTALDVAAYRRQAVHPRVGQVLFESLTDYPPVLTVAIGQHHERLDGSGYPRRVADAEMPRLARVLAVIETLLGASADGDAPLRRAAVALRIVPGEYDHRCIGLVGAAADTEAIPSAPDAASIAATRQRLRSLSARLSLSRQIAERLAGGLSRGTTASVAEFALARIRRLESGWNAMGLWALAESEDDSASVALELQVAERELGYRLRTMERECLWFGGDLLPADTLLLQPLWDALSWEGLPAA